MEKMTKKEIEQMKILQAKYKRVQRQEEDFFKEADLRKQELLDRWRVTDRIDLIANSLRVDANSLYAWLSSPVGCDVISDAMRQTKQQAVKANAASVIQQSANDLQTVEDDVPI